jgi:hypothetical protein
VESKSEFTASSQHYMCRLQMLLWGLARISRWRAGTPALSTTGPDSVYQNAREGPEVTLYQATKQGSLHVWYTCVGQLKHGLRLQRSHALDPGDIAEGCVRQHTVWPQREVSEMRDRRRGELFVVIHGFCAATSIRSYCAQLDTREGSSTRDLACKRNISSLLWTCLRTSSVSRQANRME